MAVTLYHVGRTPGQPQFGLDTFTEHYKSDSACDVVLLDGGVPQRLDAHPSYEFMFVTNRTAMETGTNSCALDIQYMGCMATEDGGPLLPPRQNEEDDSVVSASSSRGSTGQVLISPVTIQFYAPTKSLTFITYNAEGVKGTVSDPSGTPQVINVVVNDTNYTPTGLLQDVATTYFSEFVSDTIRCTEIVAGKYWHNVERKIKTLVPFLFSAVAGDYIVLADPGSGYSIGNTLTITDGTHTATVTVDTLGIGDSVMGFTTTSNTFNYSTSPRINASGGSGTNAAFNNIHIT